jgi:hypothetical protein
VATVARVVATPVPEGDPDRSRAAWRVDPFLASLTAAAPNTVVA